MSKSNTFAIAVVFAIGCAGVWLLMGAEQPSSGSVAGERQSAGTGQFAGQTRGEAAGKPSREALRRVLGQVAAGRPIDEETERMLQETGLEAEHLQAWRDMQASLAAYRDPERQREKRRAVAERLAARLESERKDPQWSGRIHKMFDDAKQAFAGAEGAHLAGAECGETLCAMHVQWKSDAAKERLYPLLRGIGLAARSDAFVHDGARDEETLVYVGRPDQPLPEIM